MRLLTLILIFLTGLAGFGQSGNIVLSDDVLGSSVATQILIFQDKEHEFSLSDVINLGDDAFFLPEDEIPNLDFTSSRFWIRFSLTNKTTNPYFILEAARPVTNKVILYQMKGEEAETVFKSGDDFGFDEKVIGHRKNLFPLWIDPGKTKHCYLELESDGEVITLPFKIHDKIAFYEQDYTAQLTNGVYYGILLLVVIIYFFFFVLLRNKAFLFYIIYVFFLALMQFALDGYGFQYLFPSGGYMANHIVLAAASLTVFFLIFYVQYFLGLKEKSKGLSRTFLIFQIVVGILLFLSLIPGITYKIGFPAINGASLITIVLTVYTIYYLKARGHHICNYFTIAFTILIVGAIAFILGNFNVIGNAEISQSALKFSSALEVIILSISMSNKYRELQKEKEEAQEQALASLMEKNALMDEINVKLEAQVKERTAEIEMQKEELAEINEEILSSIKYAKRIQEAILPSEKHVADLLHEHFVLYLPKDVVSGDFYFIEQAKTSNENALDLTIFAAVDCTGHGVPGAFMSIVGNNYLNQGLSEHSVNSPADSLDFLNKGVNKALRQDGAKTTVRDGMDIALVALEKENRVLHFAGAKNPVYLIRNKTTHPILELKNDCFSSIETENHQLVEIKGDSHPIGAYLDDELKPFTNQRVQLLKDDLIYVFSDGFADQFGGPDGKKYKYKNFKKFLLSIAHKPCQEQGELLRSEFEQWKGRLEQLDDVLIIGVRV